MAGREISEAEIQRIERAAGARNSGESRSEDAHAATKPQSPMLRDEAIDWLLARLDDAPRAVLRIEGDHGLYRAVYESWAGNELPNLTDALASLIEVLP